MEYVIGCDVGTQSTRAILLSLDGRVVGEASTGYYVDFPYPLWAEQPVERWTNALTQVIHQLLDKTGVEKSRIRGLGLATQVDGVVPVDAANNPLRPAIIWMDKRSKDQCTAMRRAITDEGIFRLTGLNLDASHVAPKIRWIAENQPEIYARTKYFLLPGSYLARYLTGELAVDYSNGSTTMLMDIRYRSWSHELCRRFEIEEERLPPLGPAMSPMGTLRPVVAEKLGLDTKTLIVIGCGDEHAACLGAGVVRPALVGDIVGTGEAVCTVSDELLFDRTHLLETHCHADPDLWLLENPGFVSGGNYRWFRDNFAHQETRRANKKGISPYQLMDECAAEIPAGSEGVIFLPCLMGAMTPTWNERARGTFFGFTLAHTRNHFMRAVLEASAYAVRDITDQMRSTGLQPQEIRVMGGGAKSRSWNQIKADVTGLPVAVPQTKETTALGAGLLALVGTGIFASLSDASDSIVHIQERLEPHLPDKSIYDEYYALYQQLYAALEPVFENAARIFSEGDPF